MVRGKFRCNMVSFFGDPADPQTGRQFTFTAVYDTSTPENKRFATATPYGEVKMNVSNPDVSFEYGKEYYLDLTPVEAE